MAYDGGCGDASCATCAADHLRSLEEYRMRKTPHVANLTQASGSLCTICGQHWYNEIHDDPATREMVIKKGGAAV